MSSEVIENYFVRVPRKPHTSMVKRLFSESKLLLLVELGNRYALIRRMRTRFVSVSSMPIDAKPKLIVHVENAKDVVRAVQLAEWAEKHV